MTGFRNISAGLLAVSIIFASCTKADKSGSADTQGILDFSETVHKSWEIINDDDIFAPMYGIFLRDSVLVSLGLLDNKFVQVYSQKDGKLVERGVWFGHGPDDLTTSRNLSRINDGVAIFDLNARRLKFFDKNFKCMIPIR